MKNLRSSAFAILAGLAACMIAISGSVNAKVTGPCANCHTMHNSQNGSPVARPDTDATAVGWGAGGTLTGGAVQSTPLNTLLVTNCVGCHSAATSSTIITDAGGNKVPIVYNTVAPSNPLAGGNFHWVVGDETKGHNVYGIAGKDSKLSQAPGMNPNSCGGTNSCHTTLAAAPDNTNFSGNMNRGGCQGCHVEVSHHETKTWYRFLKTEAGHDNAYVTGVGDPTGNWEQNPAAGHNWYKGYIGEYSSDGGSLSMTNSISAFCSGCHSKFHGPRAGNDGMGSTSPWIRHPTDIALPTTGEYAGYNPVANYSAEAPVAWTTLNPAGTGSSGPVVMCLSCHRAHGSDQPDMLRWDYATMNAGNGGAAAGKGCFTCHTGKD